MKKSTKKKIWIAAAVIAAVIAALLFAGWYAVNKTFDIVFESMLETALSEPMPAESGQTAVAPGDEPQGNAPDGVPEPGNEDGAPANGQTAGGENVPAAPQGGVQGEGAAQPDGSAGTQTDRREPQEEEEDIPDSYLFHYQFTPDQIRELQGKISFSDKLSAMALISSSLSSEDYGRLAGLVAGGITQDEIKQAYLILRDGLTQDVKDKVWEYINKYLYLLES